MRGLAAVATMLSFEKKGSIKSWICKIQKKAHVSSFFADVLAHHHKYFYCIIVVDD